MKKLVLIRHAKSDWSGFETDFNRPILRIGEQKSLKIAHHLKKIIDFNIHAIYSSSSKRTTQTILIFAPILTIPAEIIEFTDKLYVFSENELTNFVKNIPNEISNVLIFSHNFALTDFVNKFGNKKLENLSTSGAALIEFDVENWNDIKMGNTKWIVLPKQLKDE
jgi:phosphohistidine phosphatase